MYHTPMVILSWPNTPLGPLWAEVEGAALTALHWGSAPTGAQVRPTHPAYPALQAYFQTRTPLPAAVLALCKPKGGTPFQHKVWQALLSIPQGQTVTYGQLAAQVGSHPRAVGGAVGANPLPIFVPCHRVVGKNGTLTGFSAPGGLATKQVLLQNEGESMTKNVPASILPLLTLLVGLGLSACTSQPGPRAVVVTPPVAQVMPPLLAKRETRAPLRQQATVMFERGQSVTFTYDENTPLTPYVRQWVLSGVYNGASVYKQVPGVLVMVGKGRLDGRAFVPGPGKPEPRPVSADSTHAVGLVVHADGSVGPELSIRYGRGVWGCCDAPQTVFIGYVQSESHLADVQRGDRTGVVSVNSAKP